MVKNYDNMLSRFHLIPERHGQTDTDGRTDTQCQTDKFAISNNISIARHAQFSMTVNDP